MTFDDLAKPVSILQKKWYMKMNKKYTPPHPQISLERLTTMIATALIHSNKTAVM